MGSLVVSRQCMSCKCNIYLNRNADYTLPQLIDKNNKNSSWSGQRPNIKTNREAVNFAWKEFQF